MTKLNLIKTLPYIQTLPYVFSLVTVVSVAQAPALADVLKGRASQTDTIQKGAGTGLNRGDANNMVDPFGGDQAPDDAPPPAAVQRPVQKAPAKDVFDEAPNNQGGSLQPQTPRQASLPPRKAPPPPPQQRSDPNDVDNTPEMRIAWDEWHQRVASNVFQRFTVLADHAFPRSRPMTAVLAYTVTRDGQIVNPRLTEMASNPIYNILVLTAVRSLSGDLSVLGFPQGSRRMTVDKSVTFNHNSGSGVEAFKTITGDQETVRQR